MKNVIKFLKELKSKPYGKAVFFFGFYLIFFIVIFLIISLNGNKKTNDNSSDKYFENYDYSFEYKVVLDNNNYTYIGNKENDTFKYKYNDKEYYNVNNKSYIKEDELKEVENPIKFNKLLEESIIEEIINSSYVESKTIYDNGDIIYNLLTSSNTLNKIIDGKETDIEEVPNKIKVTINNNHINDISYDLYSYCKSNNLCNSLSINVNYKDYIKRS